MTIIQTRWAAVGAAIAVTLGGGGIGVARAVVDEGTKATFVPITPCRLLDTRANTAFNTGPRSTPLGAAETYQVHAAGGTNGDCSTIPATAVGLVMNVTLVDATGNTFLTVWPSDATRPDASNLNAYAGDRPTPNLVTTDLSPEGDFSLYNLAGTANVIADVAGYYEDHNHDDRYLTTEEATALFGSTLSATVNPDGTIRAGSDGITVVRNGTGDYTIEVELPDGLTLDNCAVNADTDQTTGSAPILDLNVDTTRVDDSHIDVTTDVLGVATDSGLSVIVDCNP